ncbi:MAG: hypothetical protein HQ490_01770 [Lutibacter sp.]|nr:hypothetical protein [Lutibacter sp.]
MKKLLLLIVLLVSLSINSQSRTNSVKELTIGEFNSWVSGDNVSGWDFDKGEEWKERKGYLRVGGSVSTIDIYEKDNGIKNYKDIIKSKTIQNFNEIGVIQIEFKGEKYFGFGVETVGGRYKYPSIYEDWYTFIDYNIFLFKSEDLLKLNTLNGELDLKVFVGTYGDSLNREKKYQSCYDNLKYLLENSDSDNEILKFKKTESNGLEVVRFLLPQKIKNYGKTELIDFENHYFEVSIQKFNELLSLIKT